MHILVYHILTKSLSSPETDHYKMSMNVLNLRVYLFSSQAKDIHETEGCPPHVIVSLSGMQFLFF